MSRKVLMGSAAPLGATAGPHGTNFAVSSGGDEVTLCLFDRDGTETRLVLPDRDGDVWHGFVPGVRAGQAYGFRVSGSFLARVVVPVPDADPLELTANRPSFPQSRRAPRPRRLRRSRRL
jgi:pullulanase/glycogen debranching enzyme